MKDLLLILNPRRIQECIQSYKRLDIDRLWIRNMTELEIDRRWGEIMAAAEGYDRLIIVSDDAIAPPQALQAVVELLDEGYPVVTGYGNLDLGDWRVNLSRKPLAAMGWPESFDFPTVAEVKAWPDRAVPTFLAGFALTGMSYDLWERFPFQADMGADFSLSKRLAQAGVPIVAARDGFIWHLKEQWGQHDREPRKRLLVGVEPPAVVLERAVAEQPGDGDAQAGAQRHRGCLLRP